MSTSPLQLIRPEERRAVGWSFAWFFFLLLAYYILRPVRETMGVNRGVGELKWLFLATAVVMLLTVPLYAALVARFPRRVLVPVVYHVFIVNLVLFWAGMRASDGTSVWLARTFFVWVTLFGLFAVSVFWSFLTDVFSSAQAKRLFGLIAAGGSLGAILGSLATGQVVVHLEDDQIPHLLLISAVFLEVAIWCGRGVRRGGARFVDPAATTTALDNRSTGGSLFAGITRVARSRYLLGICGYVFLTSLCGTTLYFQQAEIVRSSLESDQEKTAFFANINLATQILTLFFQFLVTGALIRTLGLAFVLCVLPCVYIMSFLALGAAPLLWILASAEVVTRASTYGISGPAKEVLFTSVTREDKYKAKSFIDTVVFRVGDSVTGQAFDALRAVSASITTIAYTLVPFAAAWALLGWNLGKRHQKRAAASPIHGLEQ